MRSNTAKSLRLIQSIALILAGASVRFVEAQTSSARYFPQTNYTVDDDQIWDDFQSRGAINTFGYPVSELLSISQLVWTAPPNPLLFI